MNTFDFKKQLTPDQLLIVRGTYEPPDNTTGADYNIEWSECVIAQNINGINIETDILPFIKSLEYDTQCSLFDDIDGLVYVYIVERGEDD